MPPLYRALSGVALPARPGGLGGAVGAGSVTITPASARGPGATGNTAGPAGSPRSAAPTVDPFYQVPSPLDPAPPGSIIRSMAIATFGQLPAGATAYRVIYHSESITAADIAVSGIVVVPGGAPPAKGFPIVSWAHGTTGLANQCAPSIQGFGSIPDLRSLIHDRTIVVATDYQGLGVPGLHPYLVGQSEAQGVLDAARSARALVDGAASNAVVIAGYSQGGQAALFAGQLAQSYAPELFIAGVAALAPATSLDEFAPATPQVRAEGGAAVAAMALYAWSRTYGDLPLGSELTPLALRAVAAIASACSGVSGRSLDTTPTSRLFRPGWSRNPVLRTHVAVNQPGQAPTSAPLLVVQGTRDSLVPYAATTRFVADSLCRAQRDTVEYAPIPGAGHGDIVAAAAPALVRWISSRLMGAPADNSCARILRATPR